MLTLWIYQESSLYERLAGTEGLEPPQHPVLETGALPVELHPYTAVQLKTARQVLPCGRLPVTDLGSLAGGLPDKCGRRMTRVTSSVLFIRSPCPHVIYSLSLIHI